MTYDDKDIDRLVELARRDALIAYNGYMITEMADMLAQLKIDRAFLRTVTRREDQMLERIHSLEGQLVKAAIMITEARERAEAAEQSRAKFMEQLRVMSGLAETAEERAHYASGVADTNINRANEAEARAEAAENEHQDFRLENDREWKAKVDYQKARAEAAEEQLRHFGELHRAEWQSQVDRAEAAEKQLGETKAWAGYLEARAETAEKREAALREVLERIANESKDYQYIARAALEAKP